MPRVKRPMRLRIPAQQTQLRHALITLRKVEGFVYQREGGSFAVSLEPGDAVTTARLLYQLEHLGLEIKKRPKAVERAYECLLKGDPQLLIGDDVETDEVDDTVRPTVDTHPEYRESMAQHHVPRFLS